MTLEYARTYVYVCQCEMYVKRERERQGGRVSVT